MYGPLSHRNAKRFNQFKNHADRIIDSNQTPHYMDFDGVNEYINCGNDSSLNFGRTNTFSMCVWINTPTTGSPSDGILSRRITSTLGCSFLNRLDDNISVYLANNPSNRIWVETNSSPLSINTWHFIVLTYDGSGLASGVKVYVDGNIQSLTTNDDNLSSFDFSNSGNFEIGSISNNHTQLFQGLIDETSVWNKELTQSEVTTIYNKGRINVDYSDMTNYDTNCISHWQMGEKSTFDTNWSIPDIKGSNTGTSVNMEETDLIPNPMTWSNFGNTIGSEDFAWGGGVLAPGGYIYAIPQYEPRILKIDTNTDTHEYLADSTNYTNGGWDGGAITPEGYIYCAPYNSTDILKIDTHTDTHTKFGNITGSGKYGHPIYSPTSNKIYCIPIAKTDVLVIDPSDDSTYTIGNVTTGNNFKYFAITLTPNGIIYAIPHDATKILKIDTNTDTVSELPTTVAQNYNSCVYHPNGFIYAFPNSSNFILKFDVSNDTFVEFPAIQKNNSANWGAVLTADGKIYNIPYNGSTTFVLDPTNNDSISYFFAATGNDKWYGGVLASNGFIYAIPYNVKVIGKFGPSTTNTFDDEFVLSPYYNKGF